MREGTRAVQIPVAGDVLHGDLQLPPDARGLVLFAHGSGSSRKSPRNRFVARALCDGGLATLLFDLLTEDEEEIDEVTAELRFDIELLAERLMRATAWARAEAATAALPLGYFGASTGAAAALVAAARLPTAVQAVVSRGGRPDLAGDALTQVRAPTLLIVGGRDSEVIQLNRAAYAELAGEARVEVVPGAGHLFVEPGALERVAELARDWFLRHLAAAERRPAAPP